MGEITKMAYKALYREWRPKDFQEVIGQDHISITLQNALISGRVAHAYLFSGPRGTGKTSSAKILAKALNCASGPTATPCNRCEMCEKITQGISLDVMEIDAASNRGIDEIRDLREKVKFAASEGRYKVYIIDEVHMLTTEAFNALLKTLEEPPSQVVFILATTEPHKIPGTILSRVQRFDFKRIAVPDILHRLKEVARELDGEIDDDALLLIARKAEGGMRDALSLLDQCYGIGDHLDRNKVLDVLGALKEEEIFTLCEAVIQGDIVRVISLLDELILEGKDPGQILKEIIENLRNLLIIKAAGVENQLVYVSSEQKPKLIEQSSKINIGKLTELITMLIKSESDLRFSTQPRITLEVALITACSGDNLAALAKEDQLPLKSVSAAQGPFTPASDVQTTPEQIKQPTSGVRIQADIQPVIQADSQADSQRAVAKHKVTEINLAQVKQEWKRLLETVKKTKIGTYAFLVESLPIGLNDGILILGFKESHNFHRDKISQPDNKLVVEEALFSVMGYQLGIKCVIAGENANDIDQDDLVSQTVKVFGKALVEVRE